MSHDGLGLVDTNIYVCSFINSGIFVNIFKNVFLRKILKLFMIIKNNYFMILLIQIFIYIYSLI